MSPSLYFVLGRRFLLAVYQSHFEAFFPPFSLVNIREACHQSFRRMHCISLSLQLSSRCNTQLMWWKLPLFHFTILVYMDSLKHLQTFKNCPLSSSVLRTKIRHSASVRRHVMLLSTAVSAAVPPDFCVSFPRERPLQRAAGTAGGCSLAELVGSLQPKPGLQPQQPG